MREFERRGSKPPIYKKHRNLQRHCSHAPVAALLAACVGQVGGERMRWEFFLSGTPLVQVTLAEHQANPGDVILSNQAWKMVMGNCEGSVLAS